MCPIASWMIFWSVIAGSHCHKIAKYPFQYARGNHLLQGIMEVLFSPLCIVNGEVPCGYNIFASKQLHPQPCWYASRGGYKSIWTPNVAKAGRIQSSSCRYLCSFVQNSIYLLWGFSTNLHFPRSWKVTGFLSQFFIPFHRYHLDLLYSVPLRVLSRSFFSCILVCQSTSSLALGKLLILYSFSSAWFFSNYLSLKSFFIRQLPKYEADFEYVKSSAFACDITLMHLS